MRDQPLHPRPPLPAIELDLAREALERVPPARLITNTRRKLRRLRDDRFRFKDQPAGDQQRPQPIARVEQQPRQHPPLRLPPHIPHTLQRLLEPPHPPQRPRACDQRRQVGLFVKTPRRLGAV